MTRLALLLAVPGVLTATGLLCVAAAAAMTRTTPQAER